MFVLVKNIMAIYKAIGKRKALSSFILCKTEDIYFKYVYIIGFSPPYKMCLDHES